MPLWRFELLIDRMPTDEEVNRLFAGYDDLGTRYTPADRSAVVWVDRDAPTIVDAVLTAVRDCDTVGLRPVGILPGTDPHSSGDEATLAAVDLALRLRAMASRVDRMMEIQQLIGG